MFVPISNLIIGLLKVYPIITQQLKHFKFEIISIEAESTLFIILDCSSYLNKRIQSVVIYSKS